MIGDLLLTWLSETGSGTITNLRSRAAWLARTENPELSDYATGRWLRDLASLGHCEADWAHGKWSVAAPTIARLPFADGLAVLAGARRPRLIRALDDEGIYYELARRPGTAGEIPAPATYLIPFENTAELKEIAVTIGVAYAGCGAARIARKLFPWRPEPAAPPSYDSFLECLAEFSPRTWQKTSPRSSILADGLYREQVNGRWRYVLLRSNAWYSADLSHGVFAELERRGAAVIRWRPDRAGRPDSGTVFIDRGAPLPPLHSRALVLCCGFAPRFGQAAETAIYDNVPREIAVRVARSLGQTLQIEH